MDDYQKRVRNVFSTQEGEKLLEEWTEQHVCKTAPPDAPDSELRHNDAVRGFVMGLIHIMNEVRRNE